MATDKMHVSADELINPLGFKEAIPQIRKNLRGSIIVAYSVVELLAALRLTAYADQLRDVARCPLLRRELEGAHILGLKDLGLADRMGDLVEQI